ncbi:MAG: RNA polymerase sigma factor [Mycobacterium leprae]
MMEYLPPLAVVVPEAVSVTPLLPEVGPVIPKKRSSPDKGGGYVPKSVACSEVTDPAMAKSLVEDSVLIKRLSAGDEEALGTLMDRYGGALLHFAHRLVGDMQLAEEIYQDTMLKAWQQASAFRVDGHLKAWLFRVARNNAIDYMRKKRVPVEEYTACLETAATTFRPDREAERSWLSAEVYEAIDELPPAYREVVDLRFFHQLCYQEIAEVLLIPLGTVKSRLNYALQRLTKILRDKGIDYSLIDL